MAKDEPKKECRTPTTGKKSTSIPAWKYDCLRPLILDAVGSTGADGFPMADLQEALAARISDEDRANLGKLGWHMMAVKLEMEVAGEIARLPGSPQRLVLA